MTRTRRFLTALLATFLAIAAVTMQPARADDSNAASVKAAADWIAEAWKKDPGKFSISRYTADGIMALSAAEAHPETVKEMIAKLQEIGPKEVKDFPAGLAKVIMAANAAGQNPRTFLGCGRDLITELKTVIGRPRKGHQELGRTVSDRHCPVPLR